MIKVCPNHDGAYDCTPFCRICEGEQEYESTGYLPCQNFGNCGTVVDEDIWEAECRLCLECSNKYWNHEIDLIGV